MDEALRDFLLGVVLEMLLLLHVLGQQRRRRPLLVGVEVLDPAFEVRTECFHGCFSVLPLLPAHLQELFHLPLPEVLPSGNWSALLVNRNKSGLGVESSGLSSGQLGFEHSAVVFVLACRLLRPLQLLLVVKHHLSHQVVDIPAYFFVIADSFEDGTDFGVDVGIAQVQVPSHYGLHVPLILEQLLRRAPKVQATEVSPTTTALGEAQCWLFLLPLLLLPFPLLLPLILLLLLLVPLVVQQVVHNLHVAASTM